MIPEAEKDEQKEILTKEINYSEYLNQQLEINAEKKIKGVFLAKTRSINFIVDLFLNDILMGFETDHTFSFEELYVLKELGLLDVLNNLQKGEQQHIQTDEIDAELKQYSSYGFSLSLFAVKDLDEKKQKLTEQLEQGSFFKTFSQLSEGHKPGTMSKSTEKFLKLSDNSLLNAVYFSRFNLLPTGYSYNHQAEKLSLEEWAKSTLLQACRKAAIYNEKHEILKITFVLAKGVELSLLPIGDSIANDDNLLDIDWQLAINSSLEPNMLEVANQSYDSRCEAFINRPTGETLIEALDFAQLKFSKDFELFLIEGRSQEFSDRFGGPYTQISRILAKILWSGDMSKIKSIFVNQKNEMPDVKELRLLAEYPNQDNALCALQAILMQLIDKTVDDQSSDITATSDSIGVKDGACFDVTSYFCQAFQCGNLYQKIINGKRFFIKTCGSHTLINLTPIWFNGIELPKGSLFTTVNNDEFAFLRLTPFMFDNREDMLSAFGTEIIKAEEGGDNVLSVVNYIDRVVV